MDSDFKQVALIENLWWDLKKAVAASWAVKSILNELLYKIGRRFYNRRRNLKAFSEISYGSPAGIKT